MNELNNCDIDAQHIEEREFAECKIQLHFSNTPNYLATKAVLNNLIDVFEKRTNEEQSSEQEHNNLESVA